MPSRNARCVCGVGTSTESSFGCAKNDYSGFIKPEESNGVDEWKTMMNEFGNNEERLKRRKEERTEKKGERQERERRRKVVKAP